MLTLKKKIQRIDICYNGFYIFSVFVVFQKHYITEFECPEKINKINETKALFFVKTSKIDKPLARMIRKEKRRQIFNVRNETSDITTHLGDNRTIEKYYEKLCIS